MTEGDPPDPDATEMVDLGDADVSAVNFESQRSVPPPLPPEVRASAAPPATPSYAPSMPRPAPRSNRFYVGLLVAFVAIGVVVGIAFAMGTRGEKKPAAASASAAAAKPPGSVMTLPTIDMTDEIDAGN